MNRFVRAALVAAILPAGLASVGCATKTGSTCEDKYRNWVDTSWPDRYNYEARQSVVAPFGQQAVNGHFLHQTLWNWYFEAGTDKLNPAGMEKLDSLARATPSPDPRLYLQTAHDIVVTPENMDKVAAQRNELNAKRAAAIRKYMGTQFGPAIDYEVAVHDAPVPSIYSAFALGAYRGQGQGYQGGIQGSGGFALPAGAGGSIGSGGGGARTGGAPGGGGAAGGGGYGGAGSVPAGTAGPP
jgi:hypothetical protein